MWTVVPTGISRNWSRTVSRGVLAPRLNLFRVFFRMPFAFLFVKYHHLKLSLTNLFDNNSILMQSFKRQEARLNRLQNEKNRFENASNNNLNAVKRLQNNKNFSRFFVYKKKTDING